jgi:hypothetical protein
MSSSNLVISLRTIFLPQRHGARNGQWAEPTRTGRQRPAWLVFIVLVLSVSWPVLGAQQVAISKLDWQKQQSETPTKGAYPEAPQRAHRLYKQSPLVLPKPEWPAAKKPHSSRGWRFKSPAVGTGSLVTAYEDQRTAVQQAKNQQESVMLERAGSTPLVGDLPEELRQFDLRLDFGLEFNF